MDLSDGGMASCSSSAGTFETRLSAGKLSLIPADLRVELEFPGSHRCLSLHLDACSLGRLSRVPTRALEPMLWSESPLLAKQFWRILMEVRRPTAASETRLDELVAALSAALPVTSSGRASQLAKVHICSTRLRRVTGYIEDHLDRPIRLSTMADLATLSPFHFLRMFKLATGSTPHAFVAERRLDRAERLLRRHRMPLAEVTIECGFVDQSHFTSAFRKSRGASPARYRAEFDPRAAGVEG